MHVGSNLLSNDESPLPKKRGRHVSSPDNETSFIDVNSPGISNNNSEACRSRKRARVNRRSGSILGALLDDSLEGDATEASSSIPRPDDKHSFIPGLPVVPTDANQVQEAAVNQQSDETPTREELLVAMNVIKRLRKKLGPTSQLVMRVLETCLDNGNQAGEHPLWCELGRWLSAYLRAHAI